MHFINVFGKIFIFHSNLSSNTSVLHQFPTFYKNILLSWKINFPHIFYTPSGIGSKFLWFKDYITTDNNSVHFKEFWSQLFTSEGEFKDLNYIKREFQLNDSLYYKFTQISHVILKKWKQILREITAEPSIIYLDDLLIKNNLLLSLEKLTSKVVVNINL